MVTMFFLCHQPRENMPQFLHFKSVAPLFIITFLLLIIVSADRIVGTTFVDDYQET